jgi:hypothetical protein
MKTILTADRLRELVDYNKDTGVFTWRLSRKRARLGAKAGYTRGDGYVFIRIDKRLYRAHRLAWLWVYGEFPAIEVDHINRNPSDNSLANLREVNSSQNKQNTSIRRDNRSGYKGVYRHSQTGRWVAQIAINGAAKHLGCFASPEDASAAYNNAASNLHTHNPCANAT